MVVTIEKINNARLGTQQDNLSLNVHHCRLSMYLRIAQNKRTEQMPIILRSESILAIRQLDTSHRQLVLPGHDRYPMYADVDVDVDKCHVEQWLLLLEGKPLAYGNALVSTACTQ